MQEHNKSLQIAIDAIELAKATANDVLKSTPYSNLLIRADQSLTQLLNLFRHTTGQALASNSIDSMEFAPITNFMGQELTSTNSEITADELNPVETDIELFKAKVLKLYADFPQMDNDAVLNTYKAEEAVIRGVAKKAGLSTYSEAELSYQFLDSIRSAMADKEFQKQTENNMELEKLKGDLIIAEKDLVKANDDVTKAKAEVEAVSGKKNVNLITAAKHGLENKELAATKAADKVNDINSRIQALTPAL